MSASPSVLSWQRLARRTARSAADWFLPSSLLVRRVRAREPLVALTFDDGPDEHTPGLLRILRRLELRATFFVLGASARRWPQHLDAMLADGHEIASHGYGHKPVAGMSARELARDLAMTDILISRSAEGTRSLFRPPRGILNLGSLAATAWLGYTIVLWSFDSLDHRPISPETVASRFERYDLHAGDIVLFHEGETATRVALPRVTSALRRRGLRAVTVSQLLQSRR